MWQVFCAAAMLVTLLMTLCLGAPSQAPPLDNPELRRAMALSLDRKALSTSSATARVRSAAR